MAPPSSDRPTLLPIVKTLQIHPLVLKDQHSIHRTNLKLPPLPTIPALLLLQTPDIITQLTPNKVDTPIPDKVILQILDRAALQTLINHPLYRHYRPLFHQKNPSFLQYHRLHHFHPHHLPHPTLDSQNRKKPLVSSSSSKAHSTTTLNSSATTKIKFAP